MKPAAMAKGCLLVAIALYLLAVTQGNNNCSEPCLIYSAGSKINAIELSTSRIVNLVPNLQRAAALDVHVSEKTLYWSDISLRVIKRMNMSSGIIEDIITEDLGYVYGLTVEWESHLIYWSDYTYGKIEVAWLDGSQRKLLFIEDVSRPRGIALYPKKGWMFWTDWGSTPKIERASLAGVDRTVLVDLSSSSQYWPNAIFVDYTEDRVYWIDAYQDVIDSTDLYGHNRRMLSGSIHPSQNTNPFDFTVYGDTLYWSDWNTDSIEKLNWTTADYLGGFGVLTSDQVFGIALLHQSRQPAGNQLCKTNNGGCSHLCLLTPDGFLCACPYGLPLLPDGKSCQTDLPKFLLFAEGRNLKQLPLYQNTTSFRIPLTKENISSPTALDYNFIDEKVYWTDVGLDTISRAFLNGSSQETIISTRLQNPYGLAVDSSGQNIYWTDSYENVIEVASLKGLYRRVLVKDDLQDPKDIILDVTRGFMYWTDWTNYWPYGSKIEKADMDGGNRTMVIHLGCSRPYYLSGLALDVAKNWLYWADSYSDKLEVYEFPSKRRREIISSRREAFLSYPVGLALHKGHLFWTDWNRYGVYRADRDTGGNVEKVASTHSRPMLIHAYDKDTNIIPVTDQCNYNNGGCSQLCLLTPFGKKCSCSDGLALQDDGQTCHAPPQFLLFADSTDGKIMKVTRQDSGSLTPLPLSDLSRPVALAYDVVEDTVYWTDVSKRTISRSFLNGSSQEVIIKTKLQSPNGLAVDIIGRNIYWTDEYTNKLEVSKLDGSYRTALVTNSLNSPRDIILDVNKRMMYWTSWNYYSKIEKAEMTGKHREVLVGSGSLYPNGLTLDHEKNRLYWVDSSYHKLEYLDLNLNNRVSLISSYYILRYPFGLTLLGDDLYWTDTRERAVYRANKETGGNVTKFVSVIGQPKDIHGYNLSAYSIPGNHPCQSNNGGCSHLCLISSNESECVCPNHLTLQEDGKTCHHKYDFQKFLLFADASKSEIFLFPLDGSDSEAKPVFIELDMYRPTALGLDIIENRIYWTDTNLNTISRVFINGSSPEVIIFEDVYDSYGLAVDPLGRNIYWTDTYANKIEVSRMDGTMRKTLIHRDLDNPRDIILDLRKGLMYWCEVGVKHKIEVANMDGDDRRVLVRRGLYYPNGLTLDEENKRLYWVDSYFYTLEYYDLERHTITTLLDRGSILSYPFGLTLLDNNLYWTDWNRDAVYQADKTTASNSTALVSGLSQPMDIHAYDRNLPLPDNPCSLSYGGCSHLCLLRPDGYRCSCPSNLTLSEDGKTCIHSYDLQKFILFAGGYSSQAGIFLLSLDGSNSEAKPIPIDLNMYRPVALGLDIVENRIYWTDTSRNTISRVFINGSSPEVIVSENVDDSYGLAVDPLGRNIYWTDTYANKIEVSRMDGSMRKTLIHQDLDNPRDIILHLKKGLMYWSEVGADHKIEVASMDGDDRRVLVRRGLYYPNGLTLDEKSNWLYWVDQYSDSLEYYDLERHTVTTLLDRSSFLRYPFGLTSLDGHLYWTDYVYDVVYRADKTAVLNPKVLLSGLRDPMDIHAYDRNKTLPDHPCSSSFGGCSHLCLLRPDGGYRCSCPGGLSLMDDGKTCNHTNDYQKFLLFADASYRPSEIFLFPLDGSNSEAKPVPIELNMQTPVALGLDIVENRIYWTDTSLNTISRVFINGSSPEVIVSDNVYNSYGLAVDPLGRNIYWTDTSANKIEVSRMDGTMRKTLIDQDLNYPSDIILDLKKGLMYWCNRGTDHKIEVANMDGDDRRVLVRRGLYYPNGLTLDDKNNRLYWVDSHSDTLEYYDLRRHTITTLLDRSSILSYPFGLTSLDDQLYWTDWYRYAVYQADKTTASNPKVLVSGLRRPMDIHAYDRDETLPDHPCSSSYGGCTHLCLLIPDGYNCSCPDHLQSGEVCSPSAVILPFSSTPINTVSNSNYQTESVNVIPSTTSVLRSSTSKTFSSLSKSTPHMKTPLFSTHPSASCKTIIITSVAPSSECDCSIYNPPVKTEQKISISSTLPSSSLKTSVSSTSASISSHNPTTHTKKQTTTPSTCKPPSSAGTTACLPNTCKNGGTCVIPGNYCKCEKIFAWHDCSVYVGSNTVEIELAVLKENQWNLLDFKIAMATACTEFFCKTGECKRKSKSGRVKRSEGATFFQPSNIIISGISSGGKTWKVEFAVLFPSAEEQAPQPISPVEITHMVNENKGSIEKAVGGTIKRITAEPQPDDPSKEPGEPKKDATATQDKGTSTILFAAGVGGIVVLVIIAMAFAVYRMRRCKRRTDERKTGNNLSGNTHTNTEFDNPAFDEDSIYDSISRARGISGAASLEQANNGGLQENGTRKEIPNRAPCDDRTYQALDKTAWLAQHTLWLLQEVAELKILTEVTPLLKRKQNKAAKDILGKVTESTILKNDTLPFSRRRNILDEVEGLANQRPRVLSILPVQQRMKKFMRTYSAMMNQGLDL
ncbi:low-density lipoprotein receptor-related protein 4-like [Oculina patagonica]